MNNHFIDIICFINYCAQSRMWKIQLKWKSTFHTRVAACAQTIGYGRAFGIEIKHTASMMLLSRSKMHRNYTSRVFNYELNLNALVFINLLLLIGIYLSCCVHAHKPKLQNKRDEQSRCSFIIYECCYTETEI